MYSSNRRKNVEILSNELTEEYLDRLCELFPITPWARIDWENVSRRKKVNDLKEIHEWLKDMEMNDRDIVILWNYTDKPGIRTDLEKALQVINDVTAIGSDTFMLCKAEGYVIEFFHDGEVMVGVSNKSSLKG